MLEGGGGLGGTVRGGGGLAGAYQGQPLKTLRQDRGWLAAAWCLKVKTASWGAGLEREGGQVAGRKRGEGRKYVMDWTEMPPPLRNPLLLAALACKRGTAV